MKRNENILNVYVRVILKVSYNQLDRPWPKDAQFVPGGGGFGPVADDGYGVAYGFADEDQINLHVSSKHSCATTDSLRFLAAIRQALIDMRQLYEASWQPTEQGRYLHSAKPTHAYLRARGKL